MSCIIPWSVVGVCLACQAAWAQNESIALVHAELSNLQSLLKEAADPSGLKNLSAPGQEVVSDITNVAVVIDNNGKWLYRHSGNNRQLFEKMGAAGDKKVVLDAMKSVYYRHVAGVSSLSGTSSLTAALSTPQGRIDIGKLLAETKASDYDPKLRELIQARVGEGVLHLSAEQKGELLADASVNQQFRGASAIAPSWSKPAWNPSPTRDP